MYPESVYKRAHAQSVCTGPFSRVGRGLGTRLGLLGRGRISKDKRKVDLGVVW